jgi:hypothetical protein
VKRPGEAPFSLVCGLKGAHNQAIVDTRHQLLLSAEHVVKNDHARARQTEVGGASAAFFLREPEANEAVMMGCS